MLLNARRSGLLTEGDNPVSLFAEQLNKAAEDNDVKAVILRINSPGGTVTATDMMYRQVRRFREKTGKPVVALQMDIAASGGYYLSCAADHIIAYPSTITGSIGVIIQTFTLKPMLERWGVGLEALTSGKNKAAGSPLGTLTDEHRAILQGLVNDFYARFREVVKQARPKIPQDQFAQVTDGRVYSGDAALGMGLVDQVGDLYDAHAKAKELAKIQRADMVRYHRPLSYTPTPYAAAPHPSPVEGDHRPTTQINLVQLNIDELPGSGTVGFYYLWQP
jgi:protease-4